MKFQALSAGVLTTAALLPFSNAAVAIRDPTAEEVSAEVIAAALKRALPNAPDGYAPTTVSCPASRPTIREASGLSPSEISWLETRRNATIDPMKTLLARLNITGLDTDTYIDNHSGNATNLPNIGIAASGGGYRALMNGAGAIAAFDSRSSNSTGAGQLGGLLQSSTYLAGLSGGSWLVGSLYSNNFTSIQQIINTDTADEGSLWQFGNSILEGPKSSGIQLLNSVGYFKDLADAADDKEDAGWNTTITDYWGRALSYQLVNATDGGPSYTFSSIALQDFFTNGSVPMPILVADSRAPGEILVGGNSTVYEFNPWELGSNDPTTYGFAPLEYMGSNFSAGVVPTDGECVRGYDNVGYVMGTSSTLFNQFFLQINNTDIPSLLKTALTDVLEKIGQNDDDIADWPNPFQAWNNATSRITTSDRLTLVDGGEDGQNIPLQPLLQPDRHVDVIFAIDSSADTSTPGANWPNGTSLVATYDRSLLPIANGTAFPMVPSQNTFVNLGLNNRPTFFGCDQNSTDEYPLIVYLPNAPYVYQSNVSTFDLEYNDTERNAVIENGWNVATMGNGSVASDWPTCVGCAILMRSLNRTNTPVPDVCTTCFTNYCWNGTTDDTFSNYTPTYKVGALNATSGADRMAGPTFALFSALAATFFLLL